MMNIKIRYRFKNHKDEIKTEILTIEDIENGALEMLYCKEVLSRDLFTGIKDKDGKEIYGGDKVQPYAHRNRKDLMVRTVVFEDGMFMLDGKESCGWHLHKSLSEAMKANNPYQVIGDIYEDTEEVLMSGQGKCARK